MRYPAILAAGLGLATLTSLPAALPAAAQTSPPALAYIQPVPGPVVQSVQDRLRQAGVYTGRIDGIWGADSQAALERFQQSNQLQVTGQLNQATAATLGLDPNALFTTPSQAAASAPAVPPPDHLLPASVRTVQSRLRALGFYGGSVDGMWGEGTQVAIERFQRGRGLQPDGLLGPATITAMGLAPETLAYR
ncbi:MAG: peptidoglycan-binding domain-containing protein [Acetobacteraceae bacterium]